MNTRHYVITGVVTYIFFLIISIPATIVSGLLDDRLPQVKIQGVNGTLWSGSARRVTLSSRHVIDNMNWSFCLWRLITAEACIDLNASYQNKPVEGQLAAGLTGNIIARNLSTEMDAKLLGNLAGLPIGELSGLISIKLESVSWANGLMPSAIGNAQWKNATITIAETADLGNVSVVFKESDDFPIVATLSNQGGHLALNGETHINDDGSYNIELKLTPNNSASNNLRSSVAMFANKQNDGSFILKNTGNLKQFGIM